MSACVRVWGTRKANESSGVLKARRSLSVEVCARKQVFQSLFFFSAAYREEAKGERKR